MAEREIEHIRRDLYGDIIALCNPDEPWAPRQKQDAIKDIETGEHSYYVQWGSLRINITVEVGFNGKYLKADNENTIKNRPEKMKIN